MKMPVIKNKNENIKYFPSNLSQQLAFKNY